MHLNDLREKDIAELTQMAEDIQIENPSNLKKHELIFAILKATAKDDKSIFGSGVLEILPDGFGFLRSPLYNYLLGADDIYVSPSQIRRFGLRTGDTITGKIRPPKDNERYFDYLSKNKKDKYIMWEHGKKVIPVFAQSDKSYKQLHGLFDK